MIPYSGFMQAFSMQQPRGIEKAAGVDKALPAMSQLGRGISALESDPNSFLAWVRKLSEINVDAMMEDGDAIEGGSVDSVADDANLQVLQALIGEAMVQHQPSPQALQLAIGEVGEDVPVGDDHLLDQKMTAGALVETVEGSPPPSQGSVRKTLHTLPQMMTVGGDNAGQGEVFEEISVEHGGQEKASWKTEPKAPDPLKAISDNQSPVDLGNPLVSAPKKRGPAVVGTDRHTDRSGGEPKHETARVVESNVFDSPLRSEKAHSAAAAINDPAPEKPKAEVPVPAAVANQQTPASQDEAASSHPAGKSAPTLRTEGKDGQDNDGQKIHSLETIKDGSGESAKTAISLQNTTRSMAADKPIAATQATLGHERESTVKTFQSTVMDQIVEKASVRSIQGRSEIHIRLKPEFLGHVQMHVATDRDQIVVRVVTDQPVVKEIIENNLHHLKTELNNQGLTIDKFDVSVNPDTHQQQQRHSFAHMFKHPSTPNNRRDTPEQERDSKGRRNNGRVDGDDSDSDRVNYFV